MHAGMELGLPRSTTERGSVCCTSSPADTLPRPQLPVEFLLLLTVPVVDPDKDDRNWKRPLNCLQLVISPLVLVLTLQSGTCEYPSPTTSLLLPQSLFRGDSRACLSNKGLPHQWSSPAVCRWSCRQDHVGPSAYLVSIKD